MIQHDTNYYNNVIPAVQHKVMSVLSGVLYPSKLNGHQSIVLQPCLSSNNPPCTAIAPSTLSNSCTTASSSALSVPCVSSNDSDISLLCQSMKAVDVNILHQHLGHASTTVVHKILSLYKPDLEINKSFSFCEACQYGKSHLCHFSLFESRASMPLELVHTDIWGLASTVSKGGFRYYIHFLDDYSRYTRMYPMTMKFEVVSVFKQFPFIVERIFDAKLSACS